MKTEPPGKGKPPRLLILDDESMTGETIARIADFAGFEARHLISPSAFFEEATRWHPDILALDLIMPEMDGVEVMAELARRGCRARLIITSGVGSRVLDAAARSAREHGLDIVGVIAKPFSASALRELLHKAIEKGGTTDDSVSERYPSREASVEDLEEALTLGHIRLAYQPKVRCHTGTIVGFEALARWHHPQLGFIPPDIFIPLAEDHGLIDRLTLQVTEQSLDWLADISSNDTARRVGQHVLQDTLLSLNISARSLENGELFDTILQHCRDRGIAPQRIVLELTETSAMQDATTSLDTLTRLRLQGFQLSIDDFGTGYSSMVQLVRLPFSELKVDKRFVMTANDSEESRAVIRSVVELGRSLGLNTTAEGVEDQETLDYLDELKCDLAQGYLISRPLPPEKVLDWFITHEAQREERRLAALAGLGLLDTPAEARFDRLTRLACRLFGVSTALISLLDRDRQWFKSRQGQDVTETSRDIAFCHKTLERDAQMVVPDTHVDPLFHDYPGVVGAPFVRFYAGRPLYLRSGEKVGTLCLVDPKPRAFGTADAELLDDLASMVENELALSSTDGHDACTGLLNRTSFREQAEAACQLCRRLGLPMALVSARLEELPTINKLFGRDAGDQQLQDLAQLVVEVAEDADLTGRYRATEITALLMGADIEKARQIGERLHRAIALSNDSQAPDQASLTPSIRVAELYPDEGPFEQRLEEAWQFHRMVEAD
ncbi:EAL domain-containing protein [Halomonas daqiaonensis]|uniref:Diguanylate cyclase (GGDEF) domain-containing protein n=1 Tax=Halomonas daqiaonensis TaxID=650850 RepID=A0A1H7LXL8_9GAMM|nr:EAL domain-containing protein [Halomonas daqiaonensis]SEL03609.1 diguanylate cyclase (GGDEF) domain-containing protein [Halomonas daqiaonensis]